MSEKPIREYDRFILRLPDGMRERLSARAKASGRSMNAEVVSMLEQVLGNPSGVEIDMLKVQMREAEAESAALHQRLNIVDQRYTAIRARMAELEKGRRKSD